MPQVRIPHARGGEPPQFLGGTVRVCAFPTHVGVNQLRVVFQTKDKRIPHARGGEPPTPNLPLSRIAAFPTHVGVNQEDHDKAIEAIRHSPRTWG